MLFILAFTIGGLLLIVLFATVIWFTEQSLVELICISSISILLAVAFLIVACNYNAFSTITLYEDRFCYKKWLFSKKKWMKYDDITQLYIDFCNYPVGISGQRVPKSIYINSATATEFQVNITYKLIAEFRKHVDKKRIHVNFDSLLSFRKKFREQLGDCLTMWQKIELKQKLGNKKKRH